MKKSVSSFSLAALVALSPFLVRAADEPAAVPPAAEPSASAAATLDSLQAGLRATQARQAQQDEELKALRDELTRRDQEAAVAQERDAMERDRKLRIYGFADIGAMRTIAPEDAKLASQFTTPLTFYLGRLNLYYDARPDPDFRFLVETRLSLYPNGTGAKVDSTGQVTRTSTMVSDTSSPNPMASVSWGGIILERSVLDWTRYSLFSVRVGLYLTPFGIYNVDHGSPTLITTTLPAYLSQAWIPERQLGIQVFGSRAIDRWELGYAATVGNGSTDGILDLGDGKAFGGRLFARRQGELRLLLGASGLYRPYRRNREQFGMDTSGGFTYSITRVVARTMLTVGVDQSLDFRGLRVRNEVVFFQSEYAQGKREAPAEALGGQKPDSRELNWGIVVAYRLWELEPYVSSDLFYSSPGTQFMTTAWVPAAGLNLYFRPNVILKASYSAVRFYKDGDTTGQAARQNLHSFNGALVWAF